MGRRFDGSGILDRQEFMGSTMGQLIVPLNSSLSLLMAEKLKMRYTSYVDRSLLYVEHIICWLAYVIKLELAGNN